MQDERVVEAAVVGEHERFGPEEGGDQHDAGTAQRQVGIDGTGQRQHR